MKKFYVICCFITLFFIGHTYCMGAVRGGGRTVSKAVAANTNTATSARAATMRHATANNMSAGVRAVAARSAIPTGTGSAPAKAQQNSKVTARAATKKSVASIGTKIATAQTNIAVNTECQQKFDGCMDSFCMLDNVPGGRCICSDDIKTYDATLAQIDALNKKSYDMATIGLNKIEMGRKAEQVTNAANDVASEFNVIEDTPKQSKRDALQLNSWFNLADDDENETEPLDKSTGDKLRQEAIELCRARIPECAADIDLLGRIYERKILSDCHAYENSIKQQQTDAEQKLRTVELSLQDAALDQLNAENKYDLGQCMQEFKKCMINTGNCGENFANCASVVAVDNTNVKQKQKPQTYSIKGIVSSIDISASTYETLVGKAPLCTSVLNQCVAVKDQVFDAFLRDVAPQLKSAELIAESNIRQNCIQSVSQCFQKACKDNIDPNNPDGSYDMCLSRPATMLNVCKVELNQCGIDASSPESAANSEIWKFVLARLASVRVDACTNEVKKCLTSEDRCGSDYTKCIGLDTTTIMHMCPYEKLTSCVEQYGTDEISSDTIYTKVAEMISGIFLGIDNALLSQCQERASSKMLEVCGDLTTCNIATEDKFIGKNSLTSYQTPDGDYVIDGLIKFSNLIVAQNNDGKYYIDIDNYMSQIENADAASKTRIQQALTGIENEIQRRINILSDAPELSMCIYGRDISQIVPGTGKKTRNKASNNRANARFPHLLDSYANVISNSILDIAKQNYDSEYARLFSAAINSTNDNKNQIYCNTLASGEASNALKNKSSGIKQINNWSIVINGVTDDVFLKSMLENQETENVLLDKDNRMIAKEVIKSIYEPASSTCHITTTLYACSGFEAIYNFESSSYSGSASASVFGIGGSAGYSQSKASNTYAGNFCNSFAEPVITEQLISFAADGAVAQFGNNTRSNLQSYYNDTSSTSNVTNKSGGGFSLGLSTGNISNIGNGTKNTTNINSNNKTKTTNNTNIGSNNKTTTNINSGNKKK